MLELTGIWLTRHSFVNDWWIKLRGCDRYQLRKNVNASTTSRKEKMKQVCFFPSLLVHAVVLAMVATIVRRLTLITILSVSKRNGPEPPPSHIKPITFANELWTYDMISNRSVMTNIGLISSEIIGSSTLKLELPIDITAFTGHHITPSLTHAFSLSL